MCRRSMLLSKWCCEKSLEALKNENCHWMSLTLQTDIGWHPYVESWVQARTLESEKVVLEGLFNR